MKDIIVVKMGGSVFDSRDTTIDDLVSLQRMGRPVVVVHGGANMVTRWLAWQGVSTSFVDGERVTDRATLDTVTAVLAGLANKEIVAAINCRGGRAAGISGVDGSLVQGKVKDARMGYMGAVMKIDTGLLEALLQAGYMPVVAPVSLHAFDRPEDAPLMLNVNGDPVAGEIAAALGAQKLVFLTDVAGVRGQSGELLERLSADEARSLLSSGAASGGMVPKLKACLIALSGGAAACIIDGRQPHALLREMEEQRSGTVVVQG
ncbi:MAG: acetylglutamate kinase [Chloroflexi bacterium]|nr:acetylglutamate kinase [Chloroflexota bacterium]